MSLLTLQALFIVRPLSCPYRAAECLGDTLPRAAASTPCPGLLYVSLTGWALPLQAEICPCRAESQSHDYSSNTR